MLTEMEEKALKFITKYIVENGIAPSMEEIGNACNFKKQRASAIVAQLSKKEAVSYKKYVPRSIRVKS